MQVQPTVFQFDQTKVRTLWIDDAPWFVAADICKVLGYEKPRNAVAQHCKGALKQGLPSQGGIQDYTIIPESDVYRLIFRSRLPAAEQFENWVTKEVLPEIRKTGGYKSAVKLPGTFIEALEALVVSEKAKELAISERNVAVTENKAWGVWAAEVDTWTEDVAVPAIETVNQLQRASDNDIGSHELALALGIKYALMLQHMRNLGIIRQRGFIPYAKYSEKFSASTDPSRHGPVTTYRLKCDQLVWLQRRLAT